MSESIVERECNYYSEKLSKAVSLGLDDFDKLILIKDWFRKFTREQQKNIIIQLREDFRLWPQKMKSVIENLLLEFGVLDTTD